MKTRISIALFAVLLTGGAAAEAKTVDRPNIIFVLYDDLDATRGGNLAGVQAELDKGVDVNGKGVGGRTPLNYAAFVGRKEIAELLIAAGADVNTKDDGSDTPLDWAIKWKQTETADLLRKHGGKTGEELKAEGK
jgi:ankyrin repeat protein